MPWIPLWGLPVREGRATAYLPTDFDPCNPRFAGGARFDGSDDTLAWQTAIDAAASGGGGIVRPSRYGTSRITAPLNGASNVEVCGNGWGTIIAVASDITIMRAVGVDNFTLRNIKLVGFNAALGYGIEVDTSSHCTIDGVWVQTPSKTGIRLNNTTYSTVTNSRVSGTHNANWPGIGIWGGGYNTILNCATDPDNIWVGINVENSSNNGIFGCVARGQHSGINVWQASNGNRVIGNDCSSTGGSGIVIDGGATTAYNNIVADNICYDNTVNGIRVREAVRTSVIGNNCSFNKQNADIYVLSNSLYTKVHSNVSNGSLAVGILVTGGCDFSSVNGNTVTNATEEGIKLFSSAYCKVNDNRSALNGKYGIVTQNAYTTVSGNTCLDNGQSVDNTFDGIYIDASRCVVTGNVSNNTAALGSQRYGINVNSGTNSVVVGNVAINNETANIQDGGTTTVLQHNTVT